MKKIVIIFLILGMFSFCKKKNSSNEVYICPMHPQVTSDKPGTCPICKMDLVVKKEIKQTKEVANTHDHSETYICPMHSQVTSDKPGICPICKMDLVVKKEIKQTKEVANTHDHSETYICPMHPEVTSDKPGICPKCKMDLVLKKEDKMKSDDSKEKFVSREVHIPQEKQTLIGVVIHEVTKRKLNKTILSSGRVAYDPELFTAITEYKEALNTSHSFSEAARIRLRQLGLSDDQIQYWSSSKVNPSDLILGGSRGKAYIYSQIYENDLALIKKGMNIKVNIHSYPGKKFTGVIIGTDTILDSKNRTLRIRSVVDDSSKLLKPEMYAEVEIAIEGGESIAIPKSAVIDTGKRQIVYLKKNDSTFVPVLVTIGIETDDFYEIRSGIQEMDKIAVSANFLIDSEARLQLGTVGE